VFSAWSSFYVMTGSSAAALIGLMFVVITLTAGDRAVRNNPDSISTYSTPTVMHFGAAFLISALFVAPWHRPIVPAIVLALGSLSGLLYVAHTAIRAMQLPYTPDLEDRVWYTLVPLLAYGVVFIGAIALPPFTTKALFAVGAGVVLLTFMGIRNAWDIVTFLVMRAGRDSN
jgi:hypothetical protein